MSPMYQASSVGNRGFSVFGGSKRPTFHNANPTSPSKTNTKRNALKLASTHHTTHHPNAKRHFIVNRLLPLTPQSSRNTASTLSIRKGKFKSMKEKLLAFRKKNRGFLGEFIGTFTLMFLGTAVNAVAAQGSIGLVGVAIGWLFAISMAVYVAGGVSEAHLNPSVTLTFALFKGFPWKMVLPYTVAQMLGAFVGSGLAFLDHKPFLDQLDVTNGVQRAVTGPGATAGIFVTFPAPQISMIHAFADEVLTTAALLMCVFAIGDNKNLAPKGNIGPVIVGGLVALLILGFGGISGVAMNPARDLGPRIMTFLAGYGSEVFTAYNNYWWIPIIAPLIGAPLGGAVYSAFVDNSEQDESGSLAEREETNSSKDSDANPNEAPRLGLEF
ncbi:hypothetical protein AAMO2058_001245100 [Amorphochlora amoebiformis]